MRAVISKDRRFEADQYVLAAGSYSPLLLRGLGIGLPVQPAKGYSVTIRNDSSGTCLSIPIIDDQLHAALVPVNGALRVAGSAEFAGYDLRIQQARIGNLLRLLGTALPRFPFALSDVRPWCGLRPMSVDGVPVIGRTSIGNLAVNTGHGQLGWTMAAGSAQLMDDLLDGRTPSIDPTPYEPGRFAAVCE
jgi:D-amino-acid dehydrogenase